MVAISHRILKSFVDVEHFLGMDLAAMHHRYFLHFNLLLASGIIISF